MKRNSKGAIVDLFVLFIYVTINIIYILKSIASFRISTLSYYMQNPWFASEQKNVEGGDTTWPGVTKNIDLTIDTHEEINSDLARESNSGEECRSLLSSNQGGMLEKFGSFPARILGSHAKHYTGSTIYTELLNLNTSTEFTNSIYKDSWKGSKGTKSASTVFNISVFMITPLIFLPLAAVYWTKLKRVQTPSLVRIVSLGVRAR